MSVNVTINGKPYEANEGELLIDLCHRNGIEIPHFCYHPGLGPDGNCRMCQVEFVSDRGNRLGISCNAVVSDGMEVLTDSDAVKQARASVEEMLLLNHPLDCPICDKSGECTLQDYYMAHDLQEGRQDFVRHRKAKAEVIGPTLVLDQQRCVLCDRCVRFLRDIAGEEQLYIAGRAHEAYITTFPGKEVTSPYSLNTVDLCPVGALTSRDFRFGSATWFLEKAPSVCTTCSRGCSMEIQSNRNTIYRMRPRHNPEVNGYWMCDEGRLNYQFVNENRITHPTIRRGGDVRSTSFLVSNRPVRLAGRRAPQPWSWFRPPARWRKCIKPSGWPPSIWKPPRSSYATCPTGWKMVCCAGRTSTPTRKAPCCWVSTSWTSSATATRRRRKWRRIPWATVPSLYVWDSITMYLPRWTSWPPGRTK
jgi:NADH-quinone oxidoreductase subunit G